MYEVTPALNIRLVGNVVFLGELSFILNANELSSASATFFFYSIPSFIATEFFFVDDIYTIVLPWFSSFVVVVGTDYSLVFLSTTCKTRDASSVAALVFHSL